jgi:hypothetical protein
MALPTGNLPNNYLVPDSELIKLQADMVAYVASEQLRINRDVLFLNDLAFSDLQIAAAGSRAATQQLAFAALNVLLGVTPP